MSKMRRKPTLAELDTAVGNTAANAEKAADGYVDSMRDVLLTANGIERGTISDVPIDADAQAQQRTHIAERESLAKVMTNAETPRCPFCSSVKLEEMPMVNWLRWRCIDCRKQFRAPAKGKAA